MRKNLMMTARTILPLCFLFVLTALTALTAQAATYTVTNANDSGAGSLRQAIADANAVISDDVIVFDATFFSVPRTITLTSDALLILPRGTLTINGPGANRLTISGNNGSRVFYNDNGIAVINGVRMTAGFPSDVNPVLIGYGVPSPILAYSR